MNDIPSGITSNIRLFADDCLIYRTINNISDTIALQADLSRLHEWSTKWQMRFNTEKCHTLQFSLRRKTIDASYHLGDSVLTTVTDYPYLGLTFTNSMSWGKHIDKATARANRILGLIRRNLRGSSHKLKETAYVSLVRPHLEYCSSIWNPHTKKDIYRVEIIQRRAARFVTHNYQRRASVTAMLEELGWSSLESRRQLASLCFLYKIQHQLVAIDPALYLTPMVTSSTRSYHPLKFMLIPSRIQLYSNSFFPRSIAWWNALPGSTLSSPSLGVFKGEVARSL